MIMTLEKIEGMNIPIGTPIEVKLNYNTGSRDLICKDLGYFLGIHRHRERGGEEIISVIINTRYGVNNAPEVNSNDRRDIRHIEEIKLLDYKKE